MIEILKKGIDLMNAGIPEEWDVRNLLQLDNGPLTITFKKGEVSITEGDVPDPDAVIQLSDERVCNYIDGSIDFMTVWRELAEPSPTDRTYIKKGSGAKLFTLLDALIKCYNTGSDFKKVLDDYKNSL